MRVVLDTNVLASATLSPGKNCDTVLRLAFAGQVELCYSTEVMAEYLRVLSRPRYHHAAEAVDAILHFIEVDGLRVRPTPHPSLRDATDTKFLEAALGAKADYLVTGNLKDFPASPYEGVKIVSPAAFMGLRAKE